MANSVMPCMLHFFLHLYNTVHSFTVILLAEKIEFNKNKNYTYIKKDNLNLTKQTKKQYTPH